MGPLYQFQVPHGCQFQAQILERLLCAVDDSNIQDNIELMDCD